jgi:hypothetical protein
MIPRKFNTDKPLSFDHLGVSQKAYAYSVGELASDLEKFLYEYFNGAYSFSSDAPNAAKIYVSVDVLALLLRKAIECTLGAEMIKIHIKSENGYILMEISTGASQMDRQTVVSLSELCANTGATLSVSENLLVFKSKILKMPVFNLRANDSRTLLRALIDWFSI